MKPKLFAAGVVLAATLATASWAQVSADTIPRPSPAVQPMTRLAIGTVKGIDAAGRSVTAERLPTEPSMPNMDRPGMGDMAGMMESCQDMMGRKR